MFQIVDISDEAGISYNTTKDFATSHGKKDFIPYSIFHLLVH